ncbi:phosphonate ABC transporter, permease protein PhnE [Salana multivorans]
MSVAVGAAPTKIKRPPDPQRTKLTIAAFLVLGLFVFAMWRIGFTPWTVFQRWDAVANLWDRMVPPDFREWRRYVSAIVETLWMVLAGTAIALVLAVPVSILAARNTTTGPIAYNICRFLITLTRAVPSLVFALVFVRAMGIGPAAGVLAMGISSVGMIGKFFSDRIEEIDLGLVEASQAAGASRIQTFVSAVLPQVLTNWISLSLYRLDINLRSAVILGYVGAGGIGLELQRVQGQLVYPRVLAIAILIFALVLIAEQLSALARRSVLGKVDSGKTKNPWGMAAKWQSYRDSVEERREQRAKAIELAATKSAEAGQKIAMPWTPNRIGQWTAGVIAILLVLVSFVVLGFGPVQFVQALGEIGPFVAGMFPPDFATNFGPHVNLMLETIWMALVATVLGLILSLPIGIIGANNATFSRFAAQICRLVTVVVRGMPELIIAVLLVVAFGLGPLAGVLALTIGSIGLAGKLIADSIEDTDLSRPMEAMDSVGATWLQRTFTATIPQASPAIIGTGLYMFDVFVRAATTLGIVGAGGIGLALDASIRGRNFNQTLALIIMIFAAVYITERLSSWLRKQLI